MTGIAELEKWITMLIQQHECVVIPRFGAFLLRHAPASANPFNGEIKPTADTLFFNPSVQNDDGLLINEIKVALGCDYATATSTLQSWVENIENTARTQRICKFGNLGNFFINAEGKILFLPQPSLNLSKNSFGLPVISVLPAQSKTESGETRIVREDVPQAAEDEPETVHEEAVVVDIREDKNSGKNRSYIWKAAAVISFMTMSVGGGFVLMNFLENTSENQMASAIPQVVKPAANKVVEKKSDEHVYPGGEEGIKKQMEHLRKGEGFVFICGGSHMNMKLADMEIKRWASLGVPAILCKKEGSSLTKIMLGRFKTEQEASDFLAKMPANSGHSAGLIISDLLPID